LEITKAVREIWDGPLFYRLSATDSAEGEEKDEKTGEWKQWGIEQSILLVGELQVSWWKTRVVQKKLSRGAALISSRSFFVPRFKKLGVDLIDTSSGGNYNKQKIPLGPSYQVPFVSAIKKAFPTLPIGAVVCSRPRPKSRMFFSRAKLMVSILFSLLLSTRSFNSQSLTFFSPSRVPRSRTSEEHRLRSRVS